MELLTKIHEGITYTEEWKPIQGYEGMYEVSSFGRVKSLDREINEFSGKVRFQKGRILTLGLNTRRYLFTALSKNGKIKSFTVHKLVAIAFLNHTPCGMKIVIDHLNSIKIDNFYKNLKETSQRDNTSRYKKSNINNLLGVSMRNGKYSSAISFNGKTINLGVFDTAEEASEYYQNALKSIKNKKNIDVKRAVYTSKQNGVSFNKVNNKWLVQISATQNKLK